VKSVGSFAIVEDGWCGRSGATVGGREGEMEAYGLRRIVGDAAMLSMEKVVENVILGQLV
jgi:hypothetical protein